MQNFTFCIIMVSCNLQTEIYGKNFSSQIEDTITGCVLFEIISSSFTNQFIEIYTRCFGRYSATFICSKKKLTYKNHLYTCTHAAETSGIIFSKLIG